VKPPFALVHSGGKHLSAIAGVKNLTHLALQGPSVTDAALKELTLLDGLIHLDLSNSAVTDAGLKELAALKSLTVLRLNGTNVTGTGLKDLAALKNLRTLTLSKSDVTDAGIKDLGALALTHLDLTHTKLTDAVGPHIAACRTLTTLRLGGGWSTDRSAPIAPRQGGTWSAVGLKALAPLAELRELHLMWPIEGGAELAGLEPLRKLDTLELLGLTDSALAELRRAGKLHALALTQAERGRPTGPDDVVLLDLSYAQVTGKGLKELAVFKNLDTLRLLQTKVTDGMKALTELKHLAALSVSAYNAVPSDLHELAALDSLEALEIGSRLGPEGARAVASIPNLLDLYAYMNDEEVAEVAVMKRLRTLRTGGSGLTDAGMRHVAKIKTLTAVAVTGALVGDEGAKALATLPALEHLDLTQTRVGDEGMKALARVKSLKTLRLGDRKVTEAGIVALAGLDNLVALDLSGANLWPTGPKRTEEDPDSPALAALATLKNLQYLDLSSSLLPKTGVTALSGLSKLRALNLDNTATQAGGWVCFTGTESLTWLRLPRVRREDAPELMMFKNLAQFQMDAFFLWDTDRAKIRRALPRCELVFGAVGRMPWPDTPLDRPPP
jgi:Leucine-rich repeat (LRR) protein